MNSFGYGCEELKFPPCHFTLSNPLEEQKVLKKDPVPSTSRIQRIKRIKEQIKEGQYQIDAKIIAKRLCNPKIFLWLNDFGQVYQKRFDDCHSQI